MSDDIPVEVWQIASDENGHEVVLLRDERGRVLPIVIGFCEAAAIWVRLETERSQPYIRRPWSHDLIQHMLERLGAELERVVIDDFTNNTFFATLHLRYRGRELVVDSRPSDALALVLRMPAPVLVSAEVMDAESKLPDSDQLEQHLDFGEDLPDEGLDFGEDLP